MTFEEEFFQKHGMRFERLPRDIQQQYLRALLTGDDTPITITNRRKFKQGDYLRKFKSF